MDKHQLIAGLILLALTAVALVFYPVYTGWKARHSAAAIVADPPLEAAELDKLNLARDVDTHVIERGTVAGVVADTSGVTPKLRRREIQPRRHRINLNPPRHSRAELARPAESPR